MKNKTYNKQEIINMCKFTFWLIERFGLTTQEALKCVRENGYK